MSGNTRAIKSNLPEVFIIRVDFYALIRLFLHFFHVQAGNGQCQGVNVTLIHLVLLRAYFV